MPREWYVYILECEDKTLYTGMTSDVGPRLAEHNAGLDAESYTFARRPVRLLWAKAFISRDAALAREHQIKGWSRAKKLALIRDDWDAIHDVVRQERNRRGSKRKPPPR